MIDWSPPSLPSHTVATPPTVLWWSRSGREYSRNRIVRSAFARLGWELFDFTPLLSSLGDVQARLQRVKPPDLVWVPCFRHRDAPAALRFARRQRIPAIFDPLISAYDKEVFEKERAEAGSAAAERLRLQEAALLARFDAVAVDTSCHAAFFQEAFNLPASRVHIIPVGAEEGLFQPQPAPHHAGPAEILFYGSFIGLQGPEIIARAAASAPEWNWTLLGDGPLKARCVELCKDSAHVRFESWIPYEALPSRIGAADILLGVFGDSPKAGRVIPNKVYQALACGRPVITQSSPAYPEPLRESSPLQSGIQFVRAGDAAAIIEAVRDLARERSELSQLGEAGRRSYQKWFSEDAVHESLRRLLSAVVPNAASRAG
jgi:glycosyltransferase involved in cell wall biosynthesis